jgi:hypothetical protein
LADALAHDTDIPNISDSTCRPGEGLLRTNALPCITLPASS